MAENIEGIILTEAELQRSILYYLNRQHDCFAWRNNSQGTFDPKRQLYRRKVGFDIKGVSDILGVHRGRFIAIEVKSKTGKLSPAQIAFLSKINRMGGLALMVNDFSQVDRMLNELRLDAKRDDCGGAGDVAQHETQGNRIE